MKDKAQVVITISRQIGSGGAYVGQQLAKKLDILYLDREIIIEAANELSLTAEELEAQDERVSSFKEYLFQLVRYEVPDVYIPPQSYPPTDRELFDTEAEIIKRITKEKSAVIIGRCASHILHDQPNHLSVFLHGSTDFRKGRLKETFNVSDEEAERMILKSDKRRDRYIQTFTGMEMNDARQYDLSIDTSKIGVDNCVELILQYLEFD